MTTDLNMVRIYVSEARGMCTDGLPVEQIDVVLGLALDKLDAACEERGAICMTQQSDAFTVTGDELDLCLDRAERAEAEVDRLHAAFDDLLEEATDMRAYVPDYFAKKWKHDEALERARAVALHWQLSSETEGRER